MNNLKSVIIQTLLLSFAFNQSISLMILDAETSDPLKDANIILIDSNGLELGGSSNLNGEFIFNKVHCQFHFMTFLRLQF